MKRTAAEMLKARLAASPVSKRLRTRSSYRKPYLTLVERAAIKSKKKAAKEACESTWRGWHARYPGLDKKEYKLCIQCKRILNREHFKKRGPLCNWCKSENKLMRKQWNDSFRPPEAADDLPRGSK